MLPAGYLFKRTPPPPGWLEVKPSHIVEVCSVADCVNDNIVDPQRSWQHNSFGLANSPDILRLLAIEADVDLAAAKLFYYTAYEKALESDGWTFDPANWRQKVHAESAAIPDDVIVPDPTKLYLLGYDVVVFGDFLEHSPLSCNSIANEIVLNKHCLFDEFSAAKGAIDSGRFGGGCEEGFYTIFSVNLVVQPEESPTS